MKKIEIIIQYIYHQGFHQVNKLSDFYQNFANQGVQNNKKTSIDLAMCSLRILIIDKK